MRNAASAILILLALGLALRLIIAYILPGSGFGVDLQDFRFWASNLADQGPFGFYTRDFLHDYTPGYLYVLWLVGLVERVLPGLDLIKVPAMLADLVVAWLIWSMTLELGASRRSALFGAALYLFVPVTWFDSVVWGQVDSFGLVFVLLGLRELWRDRPERAVAYAVMAAIVKPQLGILAFIAAAVLLRRYLVDAPSWSDLRRGPARLVSSAVVGLGTAVALCAPFQQSILDLIHQVLDTAGGYPYITVNADNPWALLTTAGGNGLAQNGQWICDAVTGTVTGTPCPPGTEQLIGPFPAVAVGIALMLLVIAALVVAVMIRPDRLTMLVALTVLAIAFFVVPTRVHERYLFPFVALGAILAAISWRWLVAFVALAAGMFLNMYAVLTNPGYQNPQIADWLGISTATRSWLAVATIAAIVATGLAWAAWQLRPGGRRGLEDELAWASDAGAMTAGSPDPPVLEAQPPLTERLAMAEPLPMAERTAMAVPVAALAATARPATTETTAMTALTARAVPSGLDDPGTAVPAPAPPPAAARRFLGPLGRRLFARPLRLDRSRALAGEIGGRLDRLDLWLVVVLLVSSLGLRMWRLDEPASMHFDEVYHARTATEFLQDWRYGLPSYIYEYTHPHLAKYAMAAGIVAWGDDQVTSTSSLGVTVLDAAIEPRWDDPTMPGDRAGDRLYVATGSEVRVYDLQTRALIATVPAPGAAALAVDDTGHTLFIATADGVVTTIDTSAAFDALRTGADPQTAIGPPVALGSFKVGIRHLFVTADGTFVLATTSGGDVASMDAGTGAVVGVAGLTGAADIASAGTMTGLVADPSAVTDASAEATTLAGIIGGDAAAYRTKLGSTAAQVVLSRTLDATLQATVQAAITDGRLTGLSFVALAVVGVADTQGVSLVAYEDPTIMAELPIPGGATGLTAASNLDAPRLFVAGGSAVTVVKLPASGEAGPATIEKTIPMPGAVRAVTFDDASVMVHVLGMTPDGTSNTIYVIEPHGDVVYADARLPFAPAAWATDVAALYPSADREAILALDASGTIASVDIGNHAFSWRLPGVIAGALTAVLMFLLARILFRRRAVGVLVAIFSLVDGMLFVQSRIAMNDVYVGLFLMAAYVLFAAIWTGAWRWRGAFWVAMPVIGLLLGLGLASKWVAAYAIAAIGLLILVRSALGRVLTIVAMIGVTVVLGYEGLVTSVPAAGQAASSGANLVFMFIMIGLTLVSVLVTVLHPIAWSHEEARFAVGAPAGAGVVLGLLAIPLAGKAGSTSVGPLSGSLSSLAIDGAIGLLLLAGLILALFSLAGRFGFGPLAKPLEPDDPARFAEPPAPAPTGWLRIGSSFGLPAAWMIGCLLVLPVAVYIVSYIPWALNSGGPAGSPLIFPAGTPLIGAWPPGHTGQTLLDLTNSMYLYHNDLRATHPASSPWWAWPFDLKPVWFYQGSFAGNTSAAIYDAGNLVIWWLGVPAFGFVCWQAFKRRSLALALLAIAFAFQWLSWVRIDRATFEYHFYTGVPFVIIGLGYFLAELWHGASRRTWLLARVSAAVAIMGPGLLWAAQSPLCAFVGVDRAYKDSPACISNPGDLVLTAGTAGLVAIVGAGLAMTLLLFPLIRPADRSRAAFLDDGRRSRSDRSARIAIAAVIAIAALVLNLVPRDGVLVNIQGFQIAPLAIGAVVVLGFVGYLVIGARDARRFVIGAVVAAIGEFLVFYPNIAALPLPSTIFNAYQGLLPTYLYPFQFPTNTDPPVTVPSLFAASKDFFGLPPGPVLGAFLVVTCLIVAYSAWSWRIALAEQEHERQLDEEGYART
jgi:C-terminal four TMM region of protein-O-mannosyltransferase/Dolichyl-phosphate-mannose-protein mannosyltransferase